MLLTVTTKAQFGDVSVILKQNFKDSTVTMEWPFKIDTQKYAVTYTYIQDEIKNDTVASKRILKWNTTLPYRKFKLSTYRSVILMYVDIYLKGANSEDPNTYTYEKTLYSKTYDVYAARNGYFEKEVGKDGSKLLYFYPEFNRVPSKLRGEK